MGEAVGLGTDLTVGVALGVGASSTLRGDGRGVGASPRFALRLLFEPKFPITVAGVDCSRVLALVLLFALAFEITPTGVALEIGCGWIFLSLSPVGVPVDWTGWLLGSANNPGALTFAFAD